MSFDPKPFTMKLKGKDYLPVAPRLAWVNSDHGDGKLTRLSISTEMLVFQDVTLRLIKKVERKDGARTRIEEETQEHVTQAALFKCTIRVLNDNGAVVHEATGHGYETQYGFGDFVTKAETASIGRALAALGYGTIQSLEFDEGDKASPIDGVVGPGVVDAPVTVVTTAASKPAAKAKAPRKAKAPEASPEAREAPSTPPVASEPSDGSKAILELLKSHAHKPEVSPIIQKFVADQRVATGDPQIKVSDFNEEQLTALYNEITPHITSN